MQYHKNETARTRPMQNILLRSKLKSTHGESLETPSPPTSFYRPTVLNLKTMLKSDSALPALTSGKISQ